MLALDSVDICEEPVNIKYKKIDNLNINAFRQQNSILFPVIYPEAFYRNIISSKETSAFLVFQDENCIGSVSTRLEPNTKWNEIRAGNTVDNFNPTSSNGPNESKMCYIMTLGILANYRHLGYGAEILEKIITDSKNIGIDCVGLHVHVDNRNALKFYVKRGFKIIGKVDDYYKKISPNSAYILELKLQ